MPVGASLRRSALRADCSAVLAPRGRAPNSPSRGRGPAAQARCARCSAACLSTERSQLAQRDGVRARASSALARPLRAPQRTPRAARGAAV